MKALEELRDTLCAELDEIARKGKIDTGSLEAVHKLTDTIKNIDKIIMLGGDGYSQSDGRDMRGYGDGNSYANRGQHYVRGHYSHDGEMSERRRDNRGRYSHDSSKGHMISELREMMNDATTDRERSAIRRCIEQMEEG